jgi:hypothetical protein
MFNITLNAGLQATLHNGPMTRKDGKPFTAEMFMPGYAPPKQSWQAQKEILGGIATVVAGKVTPQQLAHLGEGKNIFEERAARAMKLREQGASPEKIRAVMDGVQ